MEREQVLERLAQARALVREVIEATDLPMIGRTLKQADMNLHWAQWNLGLPTSLMPELEEELPPAIQPCRNQLEFASATFISGSPTLRFSRWISALQAGSHPSGSTAAVEG